MTVPLDLALIIAVSAVNVTPQQRSFKWIAAGRWRPDAKLKCAAGQEKARHNTCLESALRITANTFGNRTHPPYETDFLIQNKILEIKNFRV
ncbi:hypothetical protein [Rhizobium mongolense]|uniref:Secreted protein n=1 Tax=Rhizobium mongolense TaxID=57676 RepID=A0ABR6IG68_9HYPH|nr:hypothetical protein [Rhizobium mongolense]MBB4226745.1 hypothetical protein [Rhizobium mongolense]